MAKVTSTSYPLDGLKNNIAMLEFFLNSTTSTADKMILLKPYIENEVKPNLDKHNIKLKSKTLVDMIEELKEYVENHKTTLTMPNFYTES
jgi:hypothetical protein